MATAVADAFVLQLLILGNQFLNHDASKWAEYKQQMEAMVDEKIAKIFELTPDTQLQLTEFMDRLGQSVSPSASSVPELEEDLTVAA